MMQIPGNDVLKLRIAVENMELQGIPPLCIMLLAATLLKFASTVLDFYAYFAHETLRFI